MQVAGVGHKGFDKLSAVWQPASTREQQGDSMPKEEWGVKRVCPTTGKRFYDLNRSPIISPFTNEVVEIDIPGRKSGSVAAPDAARARKSAPKAVDTDDVILDDDVEVEADDDLLEDDEEDTVSFDELSDVAGDEDES